MTPEQQKLYELYEEVKEEICRIDNMTPDNFQVLMNSIADDLGIYRAYEQQ